MDLLLTAGNMSAGNPIICCMGGDKHAGPTVCAFVLVSAYATVVSCEMTSVQNGLDEPRCFPNLRVLVNIRLDNLLQEGLYHQSMDSFPAGVDWCQLTFFLLQGDKKHPITTRKHPEEPEYERLAAKVLHRGQGS